MTMYNAVQLYWEDESLEITIVTRNTIEVFN